MALAMGRYFHVYLYTEPSWWEWKGDLTEGELRKRILEPYEKGTAITIGGKTIEVTTLYRIRIYETDRPWNKYERKHSADSGTEVTDDYISKPPSVRSKAEDNRLEAYYHTAQICMNGHEITDSLDRSPERSAPYCPRCGKKTIMACPACITPIRGDFHVEGVLAVVEYTPPSFCHHCGNPFPWTSARIAAAKELADELDGVSKAERETLKKSIDELSSDTPRTELAAYRFKRIMGKVGKGAADAMRSLVVDVVSEAVRKMLFP